MGKSKEQYFPTYIFEEKEVALIEFEKANKIANGQTKYYGQVTNILIAVCALLVPLLFNSDNQSSNLKILKDHSFIFSVFIIGAGLFLLRYFVELQKEITINARKAVVLRRMLGLDYGVVQMILPNWRIEGAVNPFVLKYFNGWFSFQAIPFWVLLITANLISFYVISVSDFNYNLFNTICIPLQLKTYWWILSLLISLTYIYYYRTPLNDTHETNYLNIIKLISRVFRLKMFKETEHIIYMTKLSYLELDRLNVDYSQVMKYLVNIEEQSYFKNKKGFSFKSLVRGILSQNSWIRKKFGYIKSGGSTITMQLVRTILIPSDQNEYKRKILEILLAPWISKQFSKEVLLKMYISSVQYERGVNGIAKAYQYFFKEKKGIKGKTITEEESFFLVERLSNITSSYSKKRIKMLHHRVQKKPNLNTTLKIYASLEKKGLLKCSD